MRQSGWGRIVNVSSVAGVMPQPMGPDYSASKAAINNLSLSLTKALGASGVTVNTVSPGMILTPKLEEVFRQMATTNGGVASDASIRRCHDQSQISVRFDGSPTADPCIRPQWLPDSLEDSGSLRHPVNL
jgi:NAD(P)-dependent dehydrogenase (short-subunit alcohol dehydrogenase family)